MPIIPTYLKHRIVLIFSFLSFLFYSGAQQITGVWKGKIDKKKVEIKIIQKGDSLTGTSYYYESANQYRRYSIKGYFDQDNNSVVWWDDQLIEEKGNRLLAGVGKNASLSTADFNCPGGGEMYLNGKASNKETPLDIKGPVDLTKVETPTFIDEWDYIISNYTIGTNDPDIIDSVALTAISTSPIEMIGDPEVNEPVVQTKKQEIIKPTRKDEPKRVEVVTKPVSIEEKFTTRKKIVSTEIPLEGDSIELRFYDNAEIDGDSISLFLNDKLIFNHIRLSDKAYTIKLPVHDLMEINELTMVAENLGTIPPNTSYMVALVGHKRYEAKLASTENSSAVIQLKKTQSLPAGEKIKKD